MIRDRLTQDLKDAMKAKQSVRLGALRLINAAIKDRDIAARSEENAKGVTDAQIMGILAKMIKQREESAKIYDEAGRVELAEQERAEIEVILTYMPKQMSDEEAKAAIAAAIAETGATTIRDMGKVMGLLKEKYTGRMDFGAVGAAIKAALG